MLKATQATAASLLALAAMLAVPGSAQAGCQLTISTTNVSSDSTFSTCIGSGALLNNFTSGTDMGLNNTALGSGALNSNSAGDNNTASGFDALKTNTFGSSNTASGVGVLVSNLTGNDNTASGAFALSANTGGSNNTASGAQSLYYNKGSNNTAFGFSALSGNINGRNNTALGYLAGSSLTTGNNNIAIGNLGVGGESDTIRIGTQGTQTRAFMAGIRGVSVSGGQAVVVDANGQLGSVAGGLVPVVPGTGAGNTALGHVALGSNTTGNSNTASGFRALFSNTKGDGNTALGNLSLYWNSEGTSNTGIGIRALAGNTSGGNNTASGAGALAVNTTGSYNIALGFEAGKNLTIGSNNIAIGNLGVADESDTIRIGTQGTQTATYIAGILGNNISGGQAVVIDSNGRLGVGPAPSGTLLPLIPGANNTGMGTGALTNNQADGENNMASGVNALQMNTSGDNNTASGVASLNKNVSGGANTASGVSALQENTTGNNNTASGVAALLRNTGGGNNTAVGHSAMLNNTTGNGNTALGFGAGSAWTTGSNNIAIGAAGVAGESNTIRIGGTQSRTFIVGVRNIRVLKGQAVLVDANGQIGTSKSSIRYKEDVHTMGDASSPLMNLRPVTFRYKEAAPDGSKPIQYGLIAEEVEKVMPDLVIYNDQGTPESVAYDILPGLLLNEYQKQGRELAAAKAKLAAVEASHQAKLEALETELAAMRAVLNRLASAAPSNVKLATTAP